MTGLDKIISKILSDADEYAAETIAEAQNAAGDRIADAEDAGKEYKSSVRAKAVNEAAAVKARAESSAVMTERNILLNAKSELIDAAFERAKKLLVSLPAERYSAFLAAMLDEAVADAPDAPCAIYSNARDGEAIKKLISGRPNITAAGEVKIDGGFILRRGDIETNCSVSAAVDSLRDSVEGEVYAVLFDKKG